jgi:N-acetylmuramoyl-L-alanine amidase
MGAVALLMLPFGVPLFAQQVATQPRPFTVLIDPAHGGQDSGAHLSPARKAPAGSVLQEKDLVLNLALRLRGLLAADGIAVVLTRDRDLSLPAAARAGSARATHPAACISLHATASGAGVHLFTSSLDPATRAAGDAAQSAWLQASLRLASEFDSALTRSGISVTLGSTALQPLDSFGCPAIAVELAPIARAGTTIDPLTDPDYQNRILAALSAAILSWRQDSASALPSSAPAPAARRRHPLR